MIKNYDGSPILLGSIRWDPDPEDFPHLKDCLSIILTTDGRGLAQDDKAEIRDHDHV